ncbi:transglutaminase family protein [Ramlibacter sp.]|uniref:transglutaminase-like domain-containing protein n=1 Tax=Ramlibacter sp. TaxID=1917967 RepID=UPI0018223734|nr:transglutaminase family protein [Ramlibacter sp.]MBA2674436.1 transglutaminase family protein [Ramlibacter sp.]
MHLSTVETVLEYEVLAPTHFCFNLEAANWPTQNILSERLALSSGVSPRHFTDARSGNRFFRFDAMPGPLLVDYKAEVEVHTELPDPALPEVPVSRVPDDIFRYLLPTRYCESDVLCTAAQKMFGQLPPGIERVRKIVDWVHDEITYRPGSTNSTTTAQEVFVQRAGVCRDFAHLGITLCRALNIPARIVVGYVWFDEPPQDFHAVFEAWLGDRWVLFDPTGMAPVDRLVRIGTGRDAKDVAFATMFGSVEMKRKSVDVLEHDPRPRHIEESAPQLAREEEREQAQLDSAKAVA